MPDPLRAALLAIPILIAIGSIIRRHPRTTWIMVTELAWWIPAEITALYAVLGLTPKESALYVQVLAGGCAFTVCWNLLKTFMKRIGPRLDESLTTEATWNRSPSASGRS